MDIIENVEKSLKKSKGVGNVFIALYTMNLGGSLVEVYKALNDKMMF